MQKNIFQKKLCEKNFPEKILQNFFLPTLVEVSSNGLKLEENEIFLLQWVEVGWSELKWGESDKYPFTHETNRALVTTPNPLGLEVLVLKSWS